MYFNYTRIYDDILINKVLYYVNIKLVTLDFKNVLLS